MDETLISVTFAARKFSDCINRIRYQGASFLLEKNGVPVARLIPVQSSSGADLEKLANTLRQTRKAASSDAEKKELPITSSEPDPGPTQKNEPAISPRRLTLNW